MGYGRGAGPARAARKPNKIDPDLIRSRQSRLVRALRKVDGGAERDRTADLYNAIVALSQLSYSPETIRQMIAALSCAARVALCWVGNAPVSLT